VTCALQQIAVVQPHKHTLSSAFHLNSGQSSGKHRFVAQAGKAIMPINEAAEFAPGFLSLQAAEAEI
jgi:hypothetical protein